MKKNSLFILLFLLLCYCKQSTEEEQNRVTAVKNPPANAISIDSFDLQGHRGARGLLPENSIPAFLKAIDLGVNTLELDVVVSKDKKIIISHEPFFSAEICLQENGDSIEAKKEKDYNIYQYTVEEIQRFDCGSKGNTRFPQQKKMRVFKPTLKEAVREIEKYLSKKGLNKVKYNIETKCLPEGDSIFHPKPDEFSKLLYQELKDLQILGRVMIQSFDVRTLQAFKKLNEEIPLVLLVNNLFSLKKNIENLGFIPSVYSPYFELLKPETIKEAQEMGMKVIPWTINEIKDMQKIRDMGVDGLITDYPDRFKALKD